MFDYAFSYLIPIAKEKQNQTNPPQTNSTQNKNKETNTAEQGKDSTF